MLFRFRAGILPPGFYIFRLQFMSHRSFASGLPELNLHMITGLVFVVAGFTIPHSPRGESP
jgi:hypothetical protein